MPALPPAARLVKGGQLRALAVTGKTRSETLLMCRPWRRRASRVRRLTRQGVLFPHAHRKRHHRLLYHEIVKIVHEPDVKEKFAALGFDPVANSPEEFTTQIKVEIAKWGKVIKDANIKVD